MKALLLTSVCLLVLAAACGGRESASDGGSSSGDSIATGPGAAPDTAPAFNDVTVDSRLVIASTVDLRVQSLAESYNTIARMARDAGGFVAEARFAESDNAASSASLRIRVPASRHDEVLAGLRGLEGVEVRREESNAQEVTNEYTDLQSRLVNLRHTEAQYQQLLTMAGTIDDVLKVTARLDTVRGDIEQTQGQFNLLEDKSTFATITARLSLPPVAAREADSGLPSPVRVFVNALDASLVVAHAFANAAMVLLVAGLWLVPVSLIGLLVWRRLRGPLQAFSRWLSGLATTG